MVAAPDNKKVIRQVEYYFGDSNLSRDKFLQDEIRKDEQGWVPLTTMLKFKRLGDMVNGDGAAIIAALKSGNGKLMEISEDKLKIRRCPEMKLPDFDDNYKRVQKARTCYVKGFDVEETLDSLQEFFAKYGFESVYMRRVPLSKQFKGSVFVTFNTQKEADDFMNETETKYKENTLVKMTKTAYYDSKKDEKKGGGARDEKQKRDDDRYEGALERLVKFSGVTDDTVGREEITEKLVDVTVDFTCFERGQTEGIMLIDRGFIAKDVVEKMEANPAHIRSAEKVEFVALEGDEASKSFQKLKQERETLFAKLKNRKGSKGRPGGNRNKGDIRPKNTKFKFNDDDEPAEKKTKDE